MSIQRVKTTASGQLVARTTKKTLEPLAGCQAKHKESEVYGTVKRREAYLLEVDWESPEIPSLVDYEDVYIFTVNTLELK